MTLLDSESSRTVTANRLEQTVTKKGVSVMRGDGRGQATLPKQLTREEEVHTLYICVKTHGTDIYIYIK